MNFSCQPEQILQFCPLYAGDISYPLYFRVFLAIDAFGDLFKDKFGGQVCLDLGFGACEWSGGFPEQFATNCGSNFAAKFSSSLVREGNLGLGFRCQIQFPSIFRKGERAGNLWRIANLLKWLFA
jgi:hypothetical protein